MGCPVLLGIKIIGTKWIGYNAQWNRTNCGLDVNALFGSPNPMLTKEGIHAA